ncbi:MAG: hypothetical protein U0792_02480 [Gemmataceae bacterium]
MPTELLYPDDIDARLNWPPGRTSRLARNGKLPHYILPDGSIRLRWDEIAPLVQHVVTTSEEATGGSRG